MPTTKRSHFGSYITQYRPRKIKKKKPVEEEEEEEVLKKKKKSPVDLGRGVLGCRGFHSSFQTTQGHNKVEGHIRR